MFPRRAIVLVVPVALLGACRKSDDAGAGRASASASGTAAAAVCAAPTEHTGAIAWYADDLASAKQCAAARHLPLVIDEWAPWCHTCLSMKTTVFPDPGFAAVADRFVWLAIDTDKDENAALVGQYTPAAWPTYWVVADDGTVDAKFVGSSSVAQFRDFLSTGEKAYLAGAKLDPASPEAQLVLAESYVAQANHLPKDQRAKVLDQAATAYQAALAAAPADWPRRADILVDTIGVASRYADPKSCLDFAMKHMGETGRSASASDFIGNADGCADALAKTDPATATAYRQAAAARLEGLIADAGAPVSVDDRSDSMMILRGEYDALGRHADALAIADKQRQLLDDTAAKAPEPLAAMTYNWPRTEVYCYLGKHEQLAPVLEKSAADLPNQYDPPYRLAYLYKDEGKYDLALTWAKKSVALAYGPRQVRVQGMIADILRAQKDTAGELAARKQLVAMLQALPDAVARPDDLAQAQADVAALEVLAQDPPKTN